jgi:hypothetical protein
MGVWPDALHPGTLPEIKRRHLTADEEKNQKFFVRDVFSLAPTGLMGGWGF